MMYTLKVAPQAFASYIFSSKIYFVSDLTIKLIINGVHSSFFLFVFPSYTTNGCEIPQFFLLLHVMFPFLIVIISFLVYFWFLWSLTHTQPHAYFVRLV